MAAHCGIIRVARMDRQVKEGYGETRRDLRRISLLLFHFKSSKLLPSSRMESVSLTPVAQATSALLKPGVWRRGIGNKAGTCPGPPGMFCSVMGQAIPRGLSAVRALTKISSSLGDRRT